MCTWDSFFAAVVVGYLVVEEKIRMAEERVFLLTVRPPELAASRRKGGSFLSEWYEGEVVDFREVHESLLEDRATDVGSFLDAVRAVAVDRDWEDTPGTILIRPGRYGGVVLFPGSEEVGEYDSGRTKGKVRHPLVASLLGTLRIMWFAVRHPGKSAWIDHDTGEVWVSDRTA